MNDKKLMQTLRRCLSEFSAVVPAEEDLLFDLGILDSFSMLQFVLSVEECLGLRLDPGEINIDNFGSLARVARFVRGNSSLSQNGN